MHAYTARDEVREDGTQKSQRVFVNLPTEVGATEAEDIGEWLAGWTRLAGVRNVAVLHTCVMLLAGVQIPCWGLP